ATHRGGPGGLRHPLALGDDGHREAVDAFDRDAGRLGDLLDRLAAANADLDVSGGERTLHRNLHLSGTARPYGSAVDQGREPAIDAEPETFSGGRITSDEE